MISSSEADPCSRVDEGAKLQLVIFNLHHRSGVAPRKLTLLTFTPQRRVGVAADQNYNL